jgi:hypothetical protein
MHKLKKNISVFLLGIVLCFSVKTNKAFSYPLDGAEHSGINRLEGYLFSLTTKSGQKNIVRGSRLKQDSLIFSLRSLSFRQPHVDSNFSAKIKQALGPAANRASFSILDISDPEHPVLAAQNQNVRFTPASVGKIVIALGWFQALKNLYPFDIAARERLLKNAQITADDIIEKDHHEVPFWNREDGSIYSRIIQVGDTANVNTFLDWMISASSNAAGSILMKELVLLLKLGRNYESSSSQEKNSVWHSMAPAERSGKVATILRQSLILNGLDSNSLFQGSAFTKRGKQLIPSSGSTATTKELLTFLIRLEQALLVDAYSSAELKKLLYSTQNRARYASHPALNDTVAYYKSGSNYRCSYDCADNEGDILNLMNSVGIFEYPIENPKVVYLVALSTNVPRINAVDLHKEIGGSIHEVMKTIHGY